MLSSCVRISRFHASTNRRALLRAHRAGPSAQRTHRTSCPRACAVLGTGRSWWVLEVIPLELEDDEEEPPVSPSWPSRYASSTATLRQMSTSSPTRRALSLGERNGICGVNRKPGHEQANGQAAADALDEEGFPSTRAGADAGAE